MREESKGLSIFYRLLITLLAVVITVSAVLTIVYYVFTKKSVRKHAGNEVIQELENVEKQFKVRFQEELIKHIQILASNPVLDQFLMSSEIEAEINARAVERLFLQSLRYERDYESIYYVDYSGKEKVRVDKKGRIKTYRDLSKNKLFAGIESAGAGAIGVDGPFIDKAGNIRFSIGIAKTDIDTGKFGGSVIIDFTVKEFFEEMDKLSILGENPVWVFAPAGETLKQPSFKEFVFDPKPYLLNGYQRKVALMDADEGMIAYKDFSIIPEKPFLRMVISIPSSLLLKDINTALRFLLIVFLASLFTTSLIAYYISRYLSMPIIKLVGSVERLAKGDLSTQVDTKTTGEVQMLIESFNRMAGDLKRTTVSKDYIDNIIKSMNDALIVVSPDGSIRTINEAACRLLGYTESELAGTSIEKIIAEESALSDQEFNDLINKGITQNLEKTYLARDGRKIPVLFSASIMADANDIFQAVVCVAQDITERKKAEERFAKLNECLLSFSADSNSNINLLVALCGEQLGATCAIYNCLDGGMLFAAGKWNAPPDFISLDKADGHICYDVIKKGGNEVCVINNLPQTTYARTDENVLKYGLMTYVGKAVSFSGNFVGSLCVVYQDDRALTEDDKEYLGIIASAIGVEEERRSAQEKLRFALDEHKKLEAQLRHAQKMEAVGQLAGGVAHDFNNILTAIIGYGNFLQMKMSEDSPLRNYVKQILVSSERAANLTQSLLAFSRKQIINLTPQNINEIIRKVEKLLIRVIGEDIELRTKLAEEALVVMADSGQVEQVLINLAANARDAMPEGGLLTIETQKVGMDSEFLDVHGYGKEGDYALISITDTGEGIDEKIGDRIFEPFFTTKEVGKGTGLGLAIVYGIIKQHNGYINMYSELHKGTVFKLYIPLTKGKYEGTKLSAVISPSRGNETVLIAEDEDDVRSISKIALEEFGYRVIEAVNGEDAVDKFMQNKDDIELIIFDVVMPRMNGRKAYEEIRKIRPDIKVLFTSGYTADVIDRKGLLEGPNFIWKPISPVSLLFKVREILDRGAS